MSATRILHLTLHRKWFDAIATGEKKEEYRSPTPYWEKRLLKYEPGVGLYSMVQFDEIHFRNGYAKDAPWMRVKWEGMSDGIFEGEPVFAIGLGKILEIKNWTKKASTP